MKALIIGNRARYEQFDEISPFYQSVEKVFLSLEEFAQEVPRSALDADFIAVDAITPITAELISRMPNLKLIHSEGVAYNKIDVAAARKQNIYVCNNPGANAAAVAEQAIMLMLELLRDAIDGHKAVFEGRQIQKKEQMMLSAFRELGDCKVALFGLGAIGCATAERLSAFGCELFYTATHRKSAQVEQRYKVTWADKEQMLASCDIVSLHVPVTPETEGMVDDAFLNAMRADAFLVNTSRGELVNNDALCRALREGKIAGAGLDTIAPEPVSKSHPLLHLGGACKARLVLSPHIGGVSGGLFRRAHQNIWRACEAVACGKTPENIVAL